MFGARLRGPLFIAAFSIAMLNAAHSATMGLLGETHRQSVDERSYPWSSVGKLFNETGGSCSGVVIAHDKVLTAAHCVYNMRTRRFIPAEALHFLVGYRTGHYSAHARIASYEIGTGFDPQRYDQTSSNDWAVLTVSEALPADIEPLQLRRDAAAAGTRATLVGYPQDRAFAMTADRDCELRGSIEAGRLLTHTCRGIKGYSGAPILVGSGRDVQVAAIQIATMQSDGTETMLAVPAQAIRTHSDSVPMLPAAVVAEACAGTASDIWIMDIQARLDPDRLDLSPLYAEPPEPSRPALVAWLDPGIFAIAIP